MLMINSLTESDIKSRGIPVLDLYLAQEAERRNKRMGAVERVEEQCVPLNGLNFSQVCFSFLLISLLKRNVDFLFPNFRWCLHWIKHCITKNH